GRTAGVYWARSDVWAGTPGRLPQRLTRPFTIRPLSWHRQTGYSFPFTAILMELYPKGAEMSTGIFLRLSTNRPYFSNFICSRLFAKAIRYRIMAPSAN